MNTDKRGRSESMHPSFGRTMIEEIIRCKILIGIIRVRCVVLETGQAVTTAIQAEEGRDATTDRTRRGDTNSRGRREPYNCPAAIPKGKLA